MVMKPRPILRVDAQLDLASAVQKIISETGLIRTCLSCDHFNETSELCKLYNQRPPARIICYGCISWQDGNEIPF